MLVCCVRAHKSTYTTPAHLLRMRSRSFSQGSRGRFQNGASGKTAAVVVAVCGARGVVCGVLSDGSGALRGVASALRRAVPACTRVPPCAARNTTPMCARARAKRHTHNERTNSATVILLEQHRQVRSIQPHLLAQLARDRHELLLAAALERARVLLRLYAGRRASGPYVLCLHNPCRARACVRACVRERARARARARLRARCGVCSGPSEGAPGPRCC